MMTGAIFAALVSVAFLVACAVFVVPAHARPKQRPQEFTPRTHTPVFIRGGRGTWDACVAANYSACQRAIENGDDALREAYLQEQAILVRLRNLDA